LIEHEWNIEEVHSRTISLHAETAADALAIARSRPRSDWEKVTACTEYRISDGRGDFVAEVTVERRGQPEWRMEEHG
jgi:hypothetical protein